ncbi:unnamed protein product [Porites lobata]|uniref:Endonuclease/exonuclease/phosphatase domain-containing protein n=1 Tax=Porites lobata TaxID=104759 RepID=A0ABN8N8A7_9CNID|nr:unnamed protein product [Porites lobata]
MTLTDYQSFLLRLTAIEDNTKIREQRTLNLEARLDEAQVEIQALKKQLREVDKTVNNTKDSLEFTQGEHDDLVERVANCENEQSTCWDELTHLNIYSRRWNLIFYRVNESKDEDWFSLVRDVLTRNLNLPQDEVSNMKLCGAHRLGKPNRNRARPLIARFTCRADRDRVWKACYRLKNSRISMGEDLPKHIQEIRKNILIPAMKKIKQETPSHKASVIGDKLVVKEKFIFIMTCRRNGSLRCYCGCFLRPLLCYPLKYAKPLSYGANVCQSPLIIYFISTRSLNTLITKTLHSHSHFGQKTAVKVRRCQRNFLTFSLCPVDAFKTYHGSSHSKGVMTLVNPNLDVKVKKCIQDTNGRFLILDLLIDELHLILVNIYAPNDAKQQVTFFKELENQLEDFAQENTIIAGDFNCALSENDKKGGNPVGKNP